jgi:pimeloyl-ACP methyl ester carboxylesterase
MQKIRYLRTRDGVKLAWAEAGSGPLLIKAGNWLTHLAHDWDSPVWRHWLHFLAAHTRLVRYDARGCGMTDWAVPKLASAHGMEDLEDVAAAAAPDGPFALFGISAGAAAAVAYAAKHPERVSALVLYGGYSRGWARRGDPAKESEYEAIMEIVRVGWGKDNAAFREVFTSRFIPGGTREQVDWFNELCQKTTSGTVAAELIRARSQIDVSSACEKVRARTLVVHARDDGVVPLASGRQLAAAIPGAEFVELDSKNHIVLEHEPAWTRFCEAVREFLSLPAAAPIARAAPPANRLSCEGDTWAITFDGRTVRVRDRKGMHYVARMIEEPQREFHALDLAGASDEIAGDAGPLLDAKAKEAYRRRLAELEEDIEEAERMGDLGRADRAKADREALSRELARAFGLGGRERPAGSAAERARASVTRAIRQALQRVAEHHPALGAHLDRAIRTGAYCVYAPDPSAHISWIVVR